MKQNNSIIQEPYISNTSSVSGSGQSSIGSKFKSKSELNRVKTGDYTLFNHLLSVYGISRKRAEGICHELGFLPTIAFKKLSLENQNKVENFIKDISKFEKEFRFKNISDNVKINSVRGIRMRLGRPVRGQRTQTNSNTARKLNVGRIRKF